MNSPQIRILLAEDNETDALITERTLTKSGFSVTRVKNGVEALQVFRTEKFDLLITDLFMPGKNGIELISDLRQEGTSFRSIVLTASKEDESLLRSLNVGAMDFIQKPINPHIFLAKIQLILKQQPI